MQFFDPCWFPKEWLVFICFGPFSKTRYFLDSPSLIPLEDKNGGISEFIPSNSISYNYQHQAILDGPKSELPLPDEPTQRQKKQRVMCTEYSKISHSSLSLQQSYQEYYKQQIVPQKFPDYGVQNFAYHLHDNNNKELFAMTVLSQLNLLQMEQIKLYEDQNNLQIKEMQYYDLCKQIEGTTSEFSEEETATYQSNLFYFIEVLEAFQF